MKIETHKIVETIKNWLTKMGRVAILLIAIAIGFESAIIYERYKDVLDAKEMQRSRLSHDTSVAINERNELMVIDRKTGTYEIYQDTIGKMIFDLYATKFYSVSK